jgi:hypothetical protein
MSSGIYVSSSETGLVHVPGQVFAVEDFDLRPAPAQPEANGTSQGEVHLILPETPSGSIKSVEKSTHATMALRARIATPLMKADPSTLPPIRGHHSGIRSAILDKDSLLIRLKGTFP